MTAAVLATPDRDRVSDVMDSCWFRHDRVHAEPAVSDEADWLYADGHGLSLATIGRLYDLTSERVRRLVAAGAESPGRRTTPQVVGAGSEIATPAGP